MSTGDESSVQRLIQQVDRRELWSSGSLLSITRYCPCSTCEVIGLDNLVNSMLP